MRVLVRSVMKRLLSDGPGDTSRAKSSTRSTPSDSATTPRAPPTARVHPIMLEGTATPRLRAPRHASAPRVPRVRQRPKTPVSLWTASPRAVHSSAPTRAHRRVDACASRAQSTPSTASPASFLRNSKETQRWPGAQAHHSPATSPAAVEPVSRRQPMAIPALPRAANRQVATLFPTTTLPVS